MAIIYLDLTSASFTHTPTTGSFNHVWLEINTSTNAVVGILNSSGVSGQALTFTVGSTVYSFSASQLTLSGTGAPYFLSGSTTTGGTAHILGLSFNSSGSPGHFLAGEVTTGSGGSAVTYSLSSSSLSTSFVAPCFAAGTLIRTLRGDVPVESLQIGDLVVTASGEQRPVKWIGHSDLDLRGHPNPRPVFPVRIAAGALGPGRPSRDLYVSSGHSICVDLCGEVLIPAGLLVNGTTVAPIEVEEISYWHVELDSHDILIANNLPAESYLAMGNRTFFGEAGATFEALDGGERTYADFCRPVATDGPVLDFVRDRLMIQAQALGWTPSRDADLHLLVDGEIHDPLAEGDAAVFLFPDEARDVRLVSNTLVPARIGLGDSRELGFPCTGSPSWAQAESRGASSLTTRALPAACTTTKLRSAPTGVGLRASWPSTRNSGRASPDISPCSSITTLRRCASRSHRRDPGGRSRQEQEQTEALLGSVICAIGGNAQPKDARFPSHRDRLSDRVSRCCFTPTPTPASP
jgi:hypothetical protein